VAEKKGSVFGESQDNFAWLPLTTFRKLYGARRSVTIQAEARSMAVFEEAQDQSRVAMRVRRHLDYDKPDDFSIETGQSVMDLWQTATRGIYVVTIVVTAISLVVGGIVVMNIMLVSVTERTREIGVRKALGATRVNILLQFVVEAVVLCIAGGVIGILGGSLGAFALSRLMHWNTLISPAAVVLAFCFSAAIGLFFGIWPAQQAAALDPIEALRYE